jgi:hypothetical protein
VVVLLKKLSAQLTAEGKQEAAEYDKYACFCKEQADEKLYAIETSDKKIGELKAKKEMLDKDISALNADISDLSTKITKLGEDITTETEKRATDFGKYKVKAKDLNDAVSACTRAIEAMKESKGDIDGKVDLAQLSASSPLVAAALLSEEGGKQKPAGFAYSSNEILATLANLLAKFKKNKAELDVEEGNAKQASNLKVQGMSNQKTFAEKERSEKEENAEALGENLAETVEDKADETKARDADDEFMKVLTSECETKAGNWDQRSQTRSQEITAISKALEDLQKNAMGNYEATGLTDLQTNKAPAGKAAPSFLQLRGSPSKTSLLSKASGSSRHLAATQAVLDLLVTKDDASHSPVLASLTMKLTLLQQSGIDHFVKVRQLIKDLLGKLEDDAKSEATQKAYCDENIKKQTDNRDAAKLTIEEKSAALVTANSELAETKQTIADLQAHIAKNMKAMKEAGELRAEAKAANDLSLSMSTEGKASVEYALQVLKEFYNNALIQKGTYTPPNAGRDGKTVGDMAPKVFSGEYHGNQDASKGIIGILEVLSADFQRTKDKVEEEDKQSQEDYDSFKKETEEDNDAKGKELTAKELKESGLKDDIVTFTDDKKDAEAALDTAEATLEDLKKMCVEGEETYDERRDKRKEEIDALKEALSIFENWKA